ncbi:MAG TPA: hypothetical protein VN618_03320 [Solirubrobacteraceae bacterium]|nr:hypothetical protein [Solirubrobacteraceae bacterium]
MSPALVRLLQLVSTFLALVGTIVILLVSTFDSSIFDFVPLHLLLAIMALSFIFVAVHIERALYRLQSETQVLTSSVTQLEATHKAYLEATAPVLKMGTLAEAFAGATGARKHIDHLRVYAASSQQVFSFVSNSTLHVDRCSLLIRGFPTKHDSRFAQQVRGLADEWRKLAASGRIDELEIMAYDYFPTDYEILIDSEALIFGLFDYDPDEFSSVKLRTANLVEDSSAAGRDLIVEFRDRFDKLFEACRAAHGPNPY